MPPAKDAATKALEARKLELDIALTEASLKKADAERRQAEAAAKTAEFAALRDAENWTVRPNAQRVFHFNDHVYGDSVAFCMSRFRDFVDIDPAAPIELVLNSPGGSVIDGFELYDFLLKLRAEGVRIDTTIMGMGASMAGVIAQAGETRRIGPYGRLMIHEVGSIAFGKLSSLKDHLKLADSLYDQCIGILAARSKLTPEEIKKHADRKDWWLTADEALEHGFVDAILPTVKVA